MYMYIGTNICHILGEGLFWGARFLSRGGAVPNAGLARARALSLRSFRLPPPLTPNPYILSMVQV